MSKNMYLGAAGLSLLLAIYLWLTGQAQTALFVGLWVPSILTLGMFMNAK